MTDLGDISHYLKIQVDHIVGQKITFCQSIYLKKVFDCFKMTECKPTSIPMNFKFANFLVFHNRNTDQATIKWYQSAIRSLMWSDVYTRSDLTY